MDAPFYHVSRHPGVLAGFQALSHFGSARAAMDRARNEELEGHTLRLYGVDIACQAPLRVPDLWGAKHDWERLADQLHRDVPVLSAAEHRSVCAAGQRGQTAAAAALAAALERHGHDALVYENAHEDRGRDSVIILRPEQARIVGHVPLELDGWRGLAEVSPGLGLPDIRDGGVTIRGVYQRVRSAEFAAALARMTGWQTVALSDGAAGPVVAWAVRTPDGRHLDASGWTDPKAFGKLHGLRRPRLRPADPPPVGRDALTLAASALRRFAWEPYNGRSGQTGPLHDRTRLPVPGIDFDSAAVVCPEPVAACLAMTARR